MPALASLANYERKKKRHLIARDLPGSTGDLREESIARKNGDRGGYLFRARAGGVAL
jgi:hypothetical protein